MKKLKKLLMITTILLSFIYGKSLYAASSKKGQFSFFLIKEIETIQNLFQDSSQNFYEDESESDFKMSGFSIKVTGKAAIEFPQMAELEFRPSVEVYFKSTLRNSF